MKNEKLIKFLEIIKSVGSQIWIGVTKAAKRSFTWWFNRKANSRTDWFDLPALDVNIRTHEQSHMVVIFCAWKTWMFMVPSLWLAIVSGSLDAVSGYFWMTSVFFLTIGIRWLASRRRFVTSWNRSQYFRHVEPQFNIYDLYIDVLIGIILWLIGRTIVSLYIYKMNACCNEFLGETIFFEPPIGNWFASNLTPEAMSAFMHLYPEPMWSTGLKRIDTHLYYRLVTAVVSCYVLYRIAIREFCICVGRYALVLNRSRNKNWKYISKYDTRAWRHSMLEYDQIVEVLVYLYRKYKTRITFWLTLSFWWVFVVIANSAWNIISSFFS